MAKAMFLMFNHSFSKTQEQQAGKSMNVQQVIEMPELLKKLWQQVPAESNTLKSYLSPLRKWLSEKPKKNDIILIQGDFGATYLMVEFAFKLNLIPVYATSVRRATEKAQADGSIKLEHVFNFCRFRQYGI